MAEFRRHHRILTGGHFKAVFNHRQRHHGRFFSVHLLPNEQAVHRLGLAVSKKVSKLAVQRNRIKRQVRDSFRHFQIAGLQNNPDSGTKLDFVVVAKHGAANVENAVLRTELDQIWSQAMKKCATS